ncbi:hypothetical protein L345_04859, partial [Ophiophagus hannah]
MGQLCTKCVQLLYDFAVSVKTLLSGLLLDIRECLAHIADCPCLKRKNVEMRRLYKPVLYPYEEETAQEFLQHIEKGFEMSSLGKISLEALKTLAFSDHPGLQMLAALYYLHISQDSLNIHLSQEHLETYYALLKSNDLEVQQISSLSLLSFLLEGNGEWITKKSFSEKVEYNTCLELTKEHVIEMDLLEPILELLESDDITVQGNSCTCLMMLADSEACRNAIAAAGGTIPLLCLSKSHDIGVQQNAVQAIFNLTRSEWIQRVLVRQSALPILTHLLESPDTEVQYYSCAALSNVATNSQHNKAMLHVGDRFLLQTLLSLLSSGVDKKILESPCVEGLLQAIHSAHLLEDSLFYVISCLAELVKHEEIVSLLKTHMNQVQQYLIKYLIHREIRFQHLGITTLCSLQKDPDFLAAFSNSELKKHLDEICQQTEIMQELLSVAIGHMDA